MSNAPRFTQEHKAQVFSSGGGTQSTAIAALIIQGRLERPDYVVIADTGREMPSTWQYLDAVVGPALAGIGLPVHRISGLISEPAHGRNWQTHNGNTMLLPSFTRYRGEVGKLPNMCTNTWKVEVVDRFLSREFGLTPSKRVKWIGFSFDEDRRISRMMQGEAYKSGQIRFPLVELRIKRQAAIQAVREMGWPEPPRSRCYMCPNQSDREWREVARDYPAEFAQAVALDEAIREQDQHAYLHSTARPLKDADLSAEEDLFSGSCPSGECFV
jgi:3'-phosphoadenosine 5'-phosphosulfate sulfotransferase (PAPS reductase)/FAD synthetase